MCSSVALEKYLNKEALQRQESWGLKLQLAHNQKLKTKKLAYSNYGNNAEVCLYDSRTNSMLRINNIELLIISDNNGTRKNLGRAIRQVLGSKKVAIKYSNEYTEINSARL